MPRSTTAGAHHTTAAALGLLALLCLATLQPADARMVAHRHAAKRAVEAGLQARQLPADPSDANPAAPGASTTTNPLIGGVSNIVNGLTSSTTLSSNTVSAAASSSVLPSSSIPLSSSLASSSALLSSSAAVSSSAAASTSRPQASVINVTSFQTVEASESASASAAAQNTKEEPSSGIGKKTIIIIAAIASSVGLVAAIWTIFRKIKFSPSRRFEDKLNPINWSPNTGAGLRDEHGNMARNGSQLGLTRSHSGSSGGHDSINPAARVKRTNSWGSHAGSTVGSLRRGDGGMSEVRPNYAAAVPAYPPSYPATDVSGHNRFNSYGSVDRQPGYAQQPYEQVSRQPTVNAGGGRFGEGYGGSIRR